MQLSIKAKTELYLLARKALCARAKRMKHEIGENGREGIKKRIHCLTHSRTDVRTGRTRLSPLWLPNRNAFRNRCRRRSLARPSLPDLSICGIEVSPLNFDRGHSWPAIALGRNFDPMDGRARESERERGAAFTFRPNGRAN